MSCIVCSDDGIREIRADNVDRNGDLGEKITIIRHICFLSQHTLLSIQPCKYLPRIHDEDEDEDDQKDEDDHKDDVKKFMPASGKAKGRLYQF